ncbi:MAG: sugar phosphate isomerase/epimerase [Ilumatobacteraceae bacterium]
MLDRVAAAPISWGICEVPGWGIQLPVERVLAEMASLGIRATELGAIGWLPTDPVAIRATLDAYGLQLLGGFVPLALHDPARMAQSRRAAEQAARMMSAAGGTHFVTAVVSDPNDWKRPQLTDRQWAVMIENLVEVDGIAAGYGMTQVVHPHVDTLIETADEVERFLADCDVSFCLDTGHLFIGGADPVAIARHYADRIGIVHLKDVVSAVADKLRSGEMSLVAATQVGLFPALGSGDVAIADVVSTVEAHHFSGWYVIEQDVALTDGEPPPGKGPILGVAQSVAYIRELAAGRSANLSR